MRRWPSRKDARYRLVRWWWWLLNTVPKPVSCSVCGTRSWELQRVGNDLLCDYCRHGNLLAAVSSWIGGRR